MRLRMVTSLLQLSCWGFAVNSYRPSPKELLKSGGDYKQVAESLSALACLGVSPAAQKICSFTINQPNANARRTGITFQMRFAGERES